MKRLYRLLTHQTFVMGLYILLALIASLQVINSGDKHFDGQEHSYTQYNNYIIFKNAYAHLQSGQDLYDHYPEEQWDLYKYTPTFAVTFGVFAIFPDVVGLFLWNLVNVLLLFWGIYLLPRLNKKQKAGVCFILIFELLTAIQNEQSNGLMAGLLLLTFVFLERKKLFWAALCIVFSAYIKLFGIVGLILFLFYPEKIKAAAYILLWGLLCFVLPLFFIDWQNYLMQLQSFSNMLQNDHSISYGYSVMGWLHSWFGFTLNKFLLVCVGGLLLISPLWAVQHFKKYDFRLLTLLSILIWVVIFNHKAESPTFIIAMTGVGIWFIHGSKNIITISLFLLAMIFTSLSPTDLFPNTIHENYVKPYALKAVPCIFIWAYILYQQWKITLYNR